MNNYRNNHSFAEKTYQTLAVTTTDRGKLLLMLYEGAIKFLRMSKKGLEDKDIAKFCKYLSKAQAIVAELMNTLDFEKGGNVAKELFRLYDFMIFYLTEANIYKDAERLTKVEELLRIIYSAFKQVIEEGVDFDEETVRELSASIR